MRYLITVTAFKVNDFGALQCATVRSFIEKQHLERTMFLWRVRPLRIAMFWEISENCPDCTSEPTLQYLEHMIACKLRLSIASSPYGSSGSVFTRLMTFPISSTAILDLMIPLILLSVPFYDSSSSFHTNR